MCDGRRHVHLARASMAASPEKMAGSALLLPDCPAPSCGGEKGKKDGGSPAKMAAGRGRGGRGYKARARPPSLTDS